MANGSAAIRSGIAFAAAIAATPLAAQSYQCRLPDSIAVPRIAPDAAPRRLPVTGYTLALSWAPEFCRTREDNPGHARQCSGRDGRFGLVVHGLWPDSGRSWPQWCRARAPVAADMRRNLCLSPSARLLAKQWAKHGSCMAKRPATYFKVTRILYQGLQIPDFDRISREEDLTAGTVRTRFVDANRGWRADAIGVHLNSRGWLEELRLCYDKRFMPTTCDRQRRGARDKGAVKIWRGL
ncbi:ribonuclease T2 family protein [Qipengyuania marisflavi]|uniref:ribonuclease T2 family protein n=1 Tax=Qipengyuania marisflavi TaxID=2486356 RepID=UPI001FE6EFAC|nr:ribonuclease T [Qipengyuania marisflavi]